MSSKKQDVQPRNKSKKKGHKPAHANSFAFVHNVNSKKTKKILNSPNVGLCRRCTAKIEWRKKYRKYKPLTKPAVCNYCHLKEVKAAYHKACTPCSKEKSLCPFCCRKWKDIDDHEEDPEEQDDNNNDGLGAEEISDDENEMTNDSITKSELTVPTSLPTVHVCLEVQTSFAASMINGIKTIETRTYPLPESLLHKPISILETFYPEEHFNEEKNNDKKLPCFIPADSVGGPRINWEGWKFGESKVFPNMKITHLVKFKSCFQYTDQESFHLDVNKHLVEKESHFNVFNTNENSDGENIKMYGWEVECIEPSPLAGQPLPQLTRSFRSLFDAIQLTPSSSSSSSSNQLSLPPAHSDMPTTEVIPPPAMGRENNFHGRAPVVSISGINKK